MSLRTELELMLTKLSSSAGLKPVELPDGLIVEGKNVKIKLNSNSLKIETNTGRVEVSEKEIREVKLFRKTKHYLIKISNGALRIYPCEGDFTFFVDVGEEEG